MVDSQSPRDRFDAVTAAVAAVVAIAGSFAWTGPAKAFIVVPVNSLVVDSTPGPIVITAIQRLGPWSELLAFAVATLLTLAALAITVVVAVRIGVHTGDPVGVGIVVYFLVWAVAAALTRSPFPALAPAVAAGVTAAIREHRYSPEATPSPDGSRRRMLAGVATLLGAIGLGAVAGLRDTGVETSPLQAISSTDRVTIERRLRAAADRSLDLPDTPGLVSTVDGFYEVDINTIDPDVTAADWTLTITGAVADPHTLDYGDITDRGPVHRFETLRCVGDSLNGELLDTALWTGVPVAPLLDTATPQGDYVVFHAVDGYYEEFPRAALADALLAYGMNGQVLPRNHGFPVRALVPGHWGEINVKWLTEIEVVDHPVTGYWERRGWHGTGPVNTVAKVWSDTTHADGRVTVGGPAYAGIRGIDRVEVSTDGGQTWTTATLGPRLEGRDVWREWRYTWTPATASPTVVVRAVDGTGTRQPHASAQPYPSGATGWVEYTVTD